MQHSQTGKASVAFSQIVEYYPQIDTPEGAEFLQKVTRHYPWFTLAQYALLRAEGSAEQWQHLLARLPFKPYPTIVLEEKSTFDFHPINPEPTPGMEVVEGAIEYFSSLPSAGEMSEQEVDDQQIAAIVEKSTEDSDTELVTETLAQIYLAQGHKQRAIEIYLKLSLKYPEKSSYFADLISQIAAS